MNKYESSYITETPHSEDSGLRAYVNKLQNKIDYAKWKQKLVLNYNYLPLSNIKQKIQIQYDNYKRKMDAQQSKLRSIVDNEEFITLLGNLNKFRVRLLQTAQQYQLKIQNQKEMVKQLQHKANDRKNKLKQIMRNSRKENILKLQQQGITSAREIKSLARSKSTMTNLHSLTARSSKNSILQIKLSAPGINQQNIKQIYEQCIKTLTNEQSHHKWITIKFKLQNHQKSVKNANKNNEKMLNGENNMTWEQFQKLSFSKIVEELQRRDPKGELLGNLI